MNRVMLLAVCAVALGSGVANTARSQGNSPGSVAELTPIRPVHGPRYFDIRNAIGNVPGALPGPANMVRTRKALQAAIDALATDNNFHAIFIPSHPQGYWVDRPVQADRFRHFVGEPGGGSFLYGNGETTPLYFGIPRQGYGRTMPLQPIHLNGSNGSTFKGLYLDPGEHAYLFDTPFSCGQYPAANPFPGMSKGTVDCYTKTDEILLEYQQDVGVASVLTGPVMGMSTGGGTPYVCPWNISYTPFGVYLVTVANGGSGYTSAPTVTATVSGGGSGVVVTANVSGGVVTGFNVVNPGIGLTANSTVTYSITGGGGSGATVDSTFISIYPPAGRAGSIKVNYALADGSKHGAQNIVYFQLPGGLTGKVDVAIAISPRRGAVVCWVNGIQVPVLPSTGSTFPTSGSKFQPNDHVPFQIGADGELVEGTWPNYSITSIPAGATSINRNFTGIRLWSNCPYDLTRTAGSAQVRTDGKTLDWSGSRYRTQEPGVIAWIPFSDAPSDVLATRLFTVNFGSGTDVRPSVSGYLCSDSMNGMYDWQQGSIRDLSIVTQGNYSPGVAIGWVSDFEIRDCAITGGMDAITEFPTGSNYTFRLTGLNILNAIDTCLYYYFCDLHQTGKLEIGSFGRYMVASGSANTAKFQYIYAPTYSFQSTYPIHVSGAFELDRFTFDNELFLPAIAAYIRADSVFGVATTLDCVLGTISLGFVAANQSIVYIDSTEGDSTFGKVSLDRLSVYADYFRSVIEVNGRAPRGNIEVTQDLTAPWVLNSTPDGLSNVIVTHRPSNLARVGAYAKNSAFIRPRYVVDGQYGEFRVTQTGAYQTATPGTAPRLVGSAVNDDSGSGLATYIQANLAWSSGNTVAHRGPVSDFAASQFLDGYFGLGKLTTNTEYKATLDPGVPPAHAVSAALIVDQAGATESYLVPTEAAGQGYTRKPITFNPASGGVISNSSALTWTLSGSVGTATAVAFVDGSGVVSGMCPIDPIETGAGTITIGAGSLSLRSYPPPSGGALAPQMGYVGPGMLNSFEDWSLRGVPLTAPSGLVFALSTAPAGAALAEPSGNGYARVAAGAWTPAYFKMLPAGVQPGATANAAAVTFATPSGPWGTIRSIHLLDSSGSLVCKGNATISRDFGSGSAAPTIAPGGFLVEW